MATPNDFSVSLVVIGFSLIIGMIIGSYAAFNGGLFDEALMRLTDIFFAIPALVLAMAIGIALGPGITNMTIALMIIWRPPVRETGEGRGVEDSSSELHRGGAAIRFGEIENNHRARAPEISFTLIVYASLDVGTVILVYAGLSYLGLAVRPPLPDWGEMVSSYQDFMLSSPWLPLFPGSLLPLE